MPAASGPMPQRAPPDELALTQRRIADLERKIGQQQIELNFFSSSLAVVGGTRQPSGGTQTMAKVDVTALGTAYRASKIIGASIVNSANDTVGKVDDLLVLPKDHALYAVVSVGGFLGMGSKLIAVPYQKLQMSDTKSVLPNATKDELKALPAFKYASR